MNTNGDMKKDEKQPNLRSSKFETPLNQSAAEIDNSGSATVNTKSTTETITKSQTQNSSKKKAAQENQDPDQVLSDPAYTSVNEKGNKNA